MKRKLVGQHNQCAACREYFNSNFAFDKHRIGEFGIDRRCATVEEMTLFGMCVNSGGWWVTAKMPPKSISSRVVNENQRVAENSGGQGSKA